MKAPFPWFGGKSKVAAHIWTRLGDCDNYVEPFLGSAAVLLARPETHTRKLETVNDADGLLANLWRAIRADSAAVAKHADWPVSEVDLHARHLVLVEARDHLSGRLMADPDYFDARLAGWWLWGACAWIGRGWCSGVGPWVRGNGGLVRADAGQGIWRQLPHLGGAGRGINRQLPHLGDAGQGIAQYLYRLESRLRRVRIACGDWMRVCGPSVTWRHGTTGVFLDPPYDEGVGYSGGAGVSGDVWRWAVEHGARDDMRIAVCGYEDGRHVPDGWTTHRWKANGGYGSQGRGSGRANALRETIWYSPACLQPQPSLFAGLDADSGSE